MSPDKVILVPGVLPNFQTSVEYGLGPTNLLILRASIHELTVYPPSFSYFQNNFFFFLFDGFLLGLDLILAQASNSL
jgi:hypothetical protein